MAHLKKKLDKFETIYLDLPTLKLILNGRRKHTLPPDITI